MNESTRIWFFSNAGARQAASLYRSASSQPNWILRVAVLVFLVVVGVPILLLVVLAAMAAAVVFFVLAGANAVWLRLRRFLPGSATGETRRGEADGRENVRVIRRSEGN